MKMRSVVPMRIAKIGYIAISIMFCAAGVWMLICPSVVAGIMGAFLGSLMIVFGLIKLTGYFSRDLYRLAFQYDLQFGILWLVLGSAALIRSGSVLDFLCISLGICIVADCLFREKTAWEAKAFGLHSWWLVFLLAVPAGLLGLLLILCPTNSVFAVRLLGISLMVQGVLYFCVAVTMVKIVKNQMPDRMERDLCDFMEKP